MLTATVSSDTGRSSLASLIDHTGAPNVILAMAGGGRAYTREGRYDILTPNGLPPSEEKEKIVKFLTT